MTDDDDIQNYAVNHCYCYSALGLFTTTRYSELDSEVKNHYSLDPALETSDQSVTDTMTNS